MPGPLLPNNYPFGLTNQELKDTFNEMLAEWSGGRALQFDEMGFDAKLMLMQAALDETGRRETALLRAITEQAAKTADRTARWSLGIAALALVVSAAGVVVSLASG